MKAFIESGNEQQALQFSKDIFEKEDEEESLETNIDGILVSA